MMTRDTDYGFHLSWRHGRLTGPLRMEKVILTGTQKAISWTAGMSFPTHWFTGLWWNTRMTNEHQYRENVRFGPDARQLASKNEYIHIFTRQNCESAQNWVIHSTASISTRAADLLNKNYNFPLMTKGIIDRKSTFLKRRRQPLTFATARTKFFEL